MTANTSSPQVARVQFRSAAKLIEGRRKAFLPIRPGNMANQFSPRYLLIPASQNSQNMITRRPVGQIQSPDRAQAGGQPS